MNTIGPRMLPQVPSQTVARGPDALAGATALTRVTQGDVPLPGTSPMSSAQADLAHALHEDMRELFGDGH